MAKAGIFAQRGVYRAVRGLYVAIGENDDSGWPGRAISGYSRMISSMQNLS